MQRWAISPSGQIAGDSIDNSIIGGHLAFVRRADGTVTTFDVADSHNVLVRAIDRRGKITGNYSNASGQHGFLRQAHGTITTFDVPGSIGIFSDRVAINPSGEITGAYNDVSGVHGFIRSASREIESAPED